MSTKKNRRNTIYGYPNPQAGLQQEPIVMQRAPTTADTGELGTIWVDQNAQAFYVLTDSVAGVNTWSATTGGATTLASLVVDPGNATVTAGNLTVSAGDFTVTAGTATVNALVSGAATINGAVGITGNTTIGGDLAVTGNVTVTGDFDITDTASVSITSTNNAAGAITLLTNGGAAETLVIQSAQGTGDGAVFVNAVAGGVDIDGGKASANAVNIHASNAAGGITASAGTGGIALNATNGVVALTSGTGAINVGVDAVAHAISIGNNTGATSVAINGGTAGAGSIHIGQTANDVPIVIGNVTGATSITMNSGTGGIAMASTGAGDITMNSSDTVLIDSAGVLELNSSAGVISIGNDAVSQNINIGTAGARVVTIGNVTGASQVVLNSGTAGVSINSTGAGDILLNSADTVLIDSAGVLELNSSAGVIGIGNDAVSQNINIGTAGARTISIGNTGGATSVVLDVGTGALNLGTGATAHTTTLGSTNTSCTTTIQAGTGGINLNAGGDLNAQVAVDTIASPATAATIDQPLGKATFTGFTTAAGASQVLTITNAVATTTSAILCSCTNAGANDAQMTITRIEPKVGSFDVTLKNNGAAALNGNIVISFWIPA